MPRGSPDSWVRLTLELWSARVLVWVASAGRDVELTPPAHLYFFDRYRRLADWHAARGRAAKARRLNATAEEHYRAAAAGDDGPPYAAAMAMPQPRRLVVTNAVSTRRLEPPGPPNDAA